MNSVVIDTNILFSALRAKESLTRKRLLTSPEYVFYTPNFLITELFEHRNRILKKSNAREEEVYEFLSKVLHKIHFVNEEIISTGNYIQAYRLCKEVDESDSPFVALALEMEA
jgi:predicted nucleic acid-binding protein